MFGLCLDSIDNMQDIIDYVHTFPRIYPLLTLKRNGLKVALTDRLDKVNHHQVLMQSL